MFRISHVLGTHREHDRRCIAEVQALLVAAFPDLADVPDYVERKLAEQTTRVYPTVLLAAHGPGDRVLGFALADHFEWIGYAYLDFIVTQADQRGRGLGGALYEALRQDLMARGAKGLFLEVPTDDPTQVSDPAHLKANKTRLRFYEQYDARPIIGTLYDQPIRPGNPLEPRLLYDPLDGDEPLAADAAREVVAAILTLRYNYEADSPYVTEVVASIGTRRSRSASRSTPRPRRSGTRSPATSTRSRSSAPHATPSTTSASAATSSDRRGST